jgi:hypothetical protein
MQITITQLKRNADDGGVVQVYWSAVKVIDNIHGQIDGVQEFTPNLNAADFVPFENLTHEIVEQWVRSVIDLKIVESQVDAKIESYKQPPQIFGLPWSFEEKEDV